MSQPTPEPRILLGITTRNRAALLPRALRSAGAQDVPNLEIAVHDDASTDDTAGVQAAFPTLRWTRSVDVWGLRTVRQRWMMEAEADYFVSLDDDAWFLSTDEVRIALQRFARQPDLAAVAFDVLSPDAPHPQPRSQPQPTTLFVGCGHMVRLSAVRAVEGYSAAPGPYGSEEKDLCLRLMDAGYHVERLPGVHVWHEKAWAGRDHGAIHRSGVCNELAMTVRRCPAPDLCFVLPLKLASFARFWVRNPQLASSGCRGVVDTVRLGRGLWRSRRPVRRKTFWRFHRAR